MKNLENFGVLEMNAKEVKETDGGIFPLAIILLVDVFVYSAAAGYIYEKIKN